MLDALVLANGSSEDDAFLGVLGGSLEGGVAEAEGLSGEEAALCVHAVEYLVPVSKVWGVVAGFRGGCVYVRF